MMATKTKTESDDNCDSDEVKRKRRNAMEREKYLVKKSLETEEQKRIRLEKCRMRLIKKRQDAEFVMKEREKDRERKRMKRLEATDSDISKKLRLDKQLQRREIQRKRSNEYFHNKMRTETDVEKKERLEKRRAMEKEKRAERIKYGIHYKEKVADKRLRLADLKLLEEVLGVKTIDEPIDHSFNSTADIDDTKDEKLFAKFHPFKCSQCPLTVEFKSQLILHELTHISKIACPTCSKTMYEDQLEEHTIIHQNQIIKQEQDEFENDEMDDYGFQDEDYLSDRENLVEISQVNIKQENPALNEISSNIIDPPKKNKKKVLKERFKCKLCSKAFKLEQKFAYHIKSKHSPQDIIFECDKCPRAYFKKSMLRFHLMSDHFKLKTKANELQCKSCDFTTNDATKLRMHAYTWHQKKLLCNVCGKGFSCDSHLRKHVEGVHGEKKYMCNLCGLRVSHPAYLRRHMNERHITTDRYHCEFCEKVFISTKGLTDHVENVHKVKDFLVTEDMLKGVQEFKHCNLCYEKFGNTLLLKKHMKEMHRNQIVKYQCDHCHMSYEKKKFLVSHLLRGHDANAKAKSDLKPRIYNCSRCDFSTVIQGELQKHRVKNHRNYQCEQCGKYFPFPAELKRHHESKHTEDRKYSCNFCGMRSKTLVYLQSHIRELHFSDVKKFHCQFCPKTFFTTVKFKVHLKKFHNVENYEINTELYHPINVTKNRRQTQKRVSGY